MEKSRLISELEAMKSRQKESCVRNGRSLKKDIDVMKEEIRALVLARGLAIWTERKEVFANEISCLIDKVKQWDGGDGTDKDDSFLQSIYASIPQSLPLYTFNKMKLDEFLNSLTLNQVAAESHRDVAVKTVEIPTDTKTRLEVKGKMRNNAIFWVAPELSDKALNMLDQLKHFISMEMLKGNVDSYSKAKRTPLLHDLVYVQHEHVTGGQKDWHRGIIEYAPNNVWASDTLKIRLVDYGTLATGTINTVYPVVDNAFELFEFQAVACSVYDKPTTICFDAMSAFNCYFTVSNPLDVQCVFHEKTEHTLPYPVWFVEASVSYSGTDGGQYDIDLNEAVRDCEKKDLERQANVNRDIRYLSVTAPLPTTPLTTSEANKKQEALLVQEAASSLVTPSKAEVALVEEPVAEVALVEELVAEVALVEEPVAEVALVGESFPCRRLTKGEVLTVTVDSDTLDDTGMFYMQPVIPVGSAEHEDALDMLELLEGMSDSAEFMSEERVEVGACVIVAHKKTFAPNRGEILEVKNNGAWAYVRYVDSGLKEWVEPDGRLKELNSSRIKGYTRQAVECSLGAGIKMTSSGHREFRALTKNIQLKATVLSLDPCTKVPCVELVQDTEHGLDINQAIYKHLTGGPYVSFDPVVQNAAAATSRTSSSFSRGSSSQVTSQSGRGKPSQHPPPKYTTNRGNSHNQRGYASGQKWTGRPLYTSNEDRSTKRGGGDNGHV